MFRLILLGGASISSESGPLGGRIAQRRNLAFLAFLARARHGRASRDVMAALLWPESDQERARQYVSVALYAVRKELGAEAVQGVGDELALNVELVRCDASAFEEALDDGRPERAVELYAGPFMEGFHLRDAPEFERWLDLERNRLKRRYVSALEGLAGAAAEAGDRRGAADWWRRLAALEPLSSSVAVGLMEALLAAGERAEALRFMATHEELLRQELDASPHPTVVALAERIRSEPGDWAPAEPRPSGSAEDVPPPAPAPASSAGPSEAARRAAGKGRTARIAFGFAALLLAALATMVGRSLWTGERGGAAASGAPAIAVLHFENLSADTLDAYLAEGLTEEITSRLGRVGWLRVKSRSAVPRLGDVADRTPAAVGRELGVRYLVEGSVRRRGDRVRIAVRLVDASDGFRLWGEEFDTAMADLLEVEDEIAERVAESVGGRLNPWDRTALARRPTHDPTARDHFMRGNHLLGKRSPAAVARAMEEYRSAAALDPHFTEAMARAAYAHALYADWAWEHPSLTLSELHAEGLALAEVALGQDPTSAEAWLARAYVEAQRDPAGSLAYFERALALDEANAEAHHQYGDALKIVGRLEEATGALRRAVELDPGRAYTMVPLADLHLRAGRAEEARRWLDSALVLDPTLSYAYAVRGLLALWDGDPALARRMGESALGMEGGYDLPGRTVLAGAFWATGDTEAARGQVAAAYEKIADLVVPSPTDAFFLAIGLVTVEEPDRALDILERSYEAARDGEAVPAAIASNRIAWLRYYMGSPYLETLRQEPRFRRLVGGS